MNSRCLYREIFRAEVLDRIAVVFEQREITYAELCLLTDRTGQVLYARGIHRTLALLTIFYVVGAIAPWIVVFQTR